MFSHQTFKPKDLVPTPWMLAMALQADGWYLRQDIIWSKPGPMPESVTDRCTKSHEYLFLLSKAPTYFYDAESIKEPWKAASVERVATPLHARTTWGSGNHANNRDGAYAGDTTGRNRRSVWTVATAPFPEAHFATFPPDLIKPCVLAGTSEKGCCSVCGAPWERQTSSEFVKLADRRPTRKAVQPGADMADINSKNQMGYNRVTTLGWQPACACDAPTTPCTVLDPFAGAGTTLYVAKELGRHAIGIELNPAYIALAEDRMRQEVLPL